MIIGLVGEKLAGKDTVADYLMTKYQAGHFRFTHLLDDILKTLSLPISRRNEIELGLGLRKIFGSHVLIEALRQRLLKSNDKLIVVNGIRMDEFEIVKSWPQASIIYVTAPAEARFNRYLQRHEKADDGVMNFIQFKEQDSALTELLIPELGKKADFLIENIGTKADLYREVDNIVNKLKSADISKV